jgi:CMP-N-acetylneuraminate monooxygenase
MNKNIQIVVPNFKSDSVGRYMEELEFKNVLRLEFNHEYHLENTDLIISIFKSGDFRDDSGIYFSNGNFTGLLGVDSNVINFERYPKVNLYASSFAGGASGYPLMFENYKLKEQINILNKDKLFLRSKNLNTLKKIQPNFYLPYAGFFQEKLFRDKRIMQYNNKNNIDDYKKFCDTNKIDLLNVEIKDLYYFVGNKLIKSDFVQKPLAEDLSEKKYLKYFKDQYSKIDEKYIKNYFINSKFQDNLKLYVFITNDSFKKIEKVYLINFSNKKIIFKILNKTHRLKIQNKTKLSKRILILKIRKESFLNTIYNKLPWEDIMIGFQCKILRNPNIYNVKFWHHFTNIYTHSKNVKSKTDCSSCISLTQFFDKEIYENNL